MDRNKKDWANKLIDALWACQTAFKTPLGKSPCRVVFRRLCHFLFELDHPAWWVVQYLNFDLTTASEKTKLSLNELEEIRRDAYHNTRLSKKRAKIFDGKFTYRK